MIYMHEGDATMQSVLRAVRCLAQLCNCMLVQVDSNGQPSVTLLVPATSSDRVSEWIHDCADAHAACKKLSQQQQADTRRRVCARKVICSLAQLPEQFDLLLGFAQGHCDKLATEKLLHVEYPGPMSRAVDGSAGNAWASPPGLQVLQAITVRTARPLIRIFLALCLPLVPTCSLPAYTCVQLRVDAR